MLSAAQIRNSPRHLVFGGNRLRDVTVQSAALTIALKSTDGASYFSDDRKDDDPRIQGKKGEDKKSLTEIEHVVHKLEVEKESTSLGGSLPSQTPPSRAFLSYSEDSQIPKSHGRPAYLSHSLSHIHLTNAYLSRIKVKTKGHKRTYVI